MRINRATVQRISSISPIWIVPAVALAIALWLAVQARMEKGATIEIEFANATDIIPGQTQIRLKDVRVGLVKDVKLTRDLKSVRVIAELDREVSQNLSKNSRFWVVTPRISATGVSNLGTLISGVYIVMDPGEPGEFETKFKGLKEPPVYQSDEPGMQYVMQAEELGSIDIGSPLYYRQIRVGEVTSYKLAEDNNHVDINVFIRAPYNKLVQTRSRFWNVSGFGLSMGADGIKAHMASLASLISGGIAFDNAAGFENATLAEEGRRFFLYPDRESVQEGRFNIKYYYLLRFSDSVRGLTVGAPVEFRGIHIGEVVDVSLDTADNIEKSLLVYIAMEPQRLEPNTNPTREEVDARMESLVAQGLRAKMKTASMLTGSRYIDLVFENDANDGHVAFVRAENYSEIPTANGTIDDLTREVAGIVGKVNNIPFEQIGSDLSASMSSLKTILGDLERNQTADKMDAAVANLDKTLENAKQALGQLDSVLQSVDHAIAPDSELKYELTEMLKAVSEAAGSVELFVNELNRNPNALISGVDKDDE
ncbi:intermembrane transport protein PqiB [Saccharophagus degradans]|uniref:MlaD family protein n=1 Tax=Saccharophagus degradans TaxID=86304 RepID=A0AAW7XAS0_9GAMM|nr:MlaD family protein [Saccharophagus degradans]MDO6423686.1 MlaD family protein [Saccharophagus degradans]MDO6607643.1 MlaD family protein [Saccharophagus degradans]